jgi:hypothetical protein
VNLHQQLMSFMSPGIRTSTTTDWLPNAGIAPSSDRTAPGRTSRFSAPDSNVPSAPGFPPILMPLKSTSSSYRVPVEEVSEALHQRTDSDLR